MAYSYAQLEGFWNQAGGDQSVAPTMAAIAEAESSGSDVVQKGQPYSSTGWGLWQITPGNSEPSIGTDNQLLNPLTNARAAVAKYNSQGLSAWTTYTSGAYKQFYQGNVPPSSGGVTNTDFATGNTANSPLQSVGNAFLDGLMKGLGVSDVKDLLERLGLIVFGSLILIVGVIKFSGTGGAVMGTVKSGGPIGSARRAAVGTSSKTADEAAKAVKEKAGV